MIRILTIALGLHLALPAPALAGPGGPPGHDHAPPGTTDGTGRERARVAVTLWSDTLELFMEYPVLLADEPGRFIIHLTILAGFQPVRDGSVTLAFRGPDGARHEFTAAELLREGIFAPTVRLPRPGAYEFVLTHAGSRAIGEFAIDGFAVAGSPEASQADDAAAAPDGIVFLKEQQWKVPFATAAAAAREVRRSVWAIAEVLPAPPAFAEIAAPVDGVVQAAGIGGLALPGARVKKGDVVATIAPTVQGGGWTTARLALAQAERNYERARRLRERDAISDREYEETQNEYLARRAGHDRLAVAGDEEVLALLAPIDGQVIEWHVRPGRQLRAGDPLLAIADPSLVWLRVNVYESDFRGLGRPVGVFVNAGSGGDGWTVGPTAMRVVSEGGAMDPATRTIPLLLEIANDEGRLTINESTPVELLAGDGGLATAVPVSAIYEDEGVNVVFVQTGGESFAKRAVRTGPRHGGWATILEGLRPGERVVTRGGYHVKLAGTTAEIGHGHAH